jgi:hypothetical protein
MTRFLSERYKRILISYLQLHIFLSLIETSTSAKKKELCIIKCYRQLTPNNNSIVLKYSKYKNKYFNIYIFLFFFKLIFRYLNIFLYLI